MAKNQKSYTPEFKQQIVDLYNAGGTSYKFGIYWRSDIGRIAVMKPGASRGAVRRCAADII